MNLIRSCRSALSAAVLVATATAGVVSLLNVPALAQLAGGMPSQTMTSLGAANQFKGPRGSDRPKPEVQPDALPGAKPGSAVAPATRLPGDMSPTEALFDAINRGDIAGARDALNRGADMSGRNILGMTPMELSVDLGRNDISFLLLSMRSEDQAPRQPSTAAAAAAAGQTALATKQPVAKGRIPATAKAPNVVVAAPQVPMAPRLFANDGGTPNPTVGFLGFDPSRSSH